MILLVEDSEFKQNDVTALLEELELGSKLVVAKSLTTAISVALDGTPNVIILDMQFPVTDEEFVTTNDLAFEFISTISRRGFICPIVILTSEDSNEVTKRFTEKFKDLELLKEQVKEIITYSSSSIEWKIKLTSNLVAILGLCKETPNEV